MEQGEGMPRRIQFRVWVTLKPSNEESNGSEDGQFNGNWVCIGIVTYRPRGFEEARRIQFCKDHKDSGFLNCGIF